jgi:hypothetical protein
MNFESSANNKKDNKKKCIKLNKKRLENLKFFQKYKSKSYGKHVEIIKKFHTIISNLTGRKFIADSHEKRELENYFYLKFLKLQFVLTVLSVCSLLSGIFYYECTLNEINFYSREKIIKLQNNYSLSENTVNLEPSFELHYHLNDKISSNRYIRNLKINGTTFTINKDSIYLDEVNKIRQIVAVKTFFTIDYILNEFHEFHNVYITYLWICFISTILSIMIIWIYQLVYLDYLLLMQKIQSHSNIFTAKLYLEPLTHTIFLLLHPSPFLIHLTYSSYNSLYKQNIDRGINSILTIVLLLRVIYIVKYSLFASIYMSPKSNEICKTFLFENNLIFTWKSLMKNKPKFLLLIVGVFLIYFFSFSIRVFERGYNPELYNNFINPIWFIIVTMTTVGYGDITPKTNEGKIIATVSCVIGVFIISLLIITITNFFTMNFHDINSFLILEKAKSNEGREDRAQTVIYCFSVFYFKRRKLYNENKKKDISFKQKIISKNNFISRTKLDCININKESILYLFNLLNNLFSAISKFHNNEEVIDSVSYENYQINAINKNIAFFKSEYDTLIEKKSSIINLTNELLLELNFIIKSDFEH